MHVKSWVIDKKVYVGGSCNFTTNAESSNEEHLVIAKDPEANATYQAWFSELWAKATILDADDVQRREAAALARKSVSRSRSETK